MLLPAAYLFNPENDLALGLGCDNYTPRPHAASLHRAGALLPAWWAQGCDTIVAPNVNDAQLKWLETNYSLTPRPYKTGMQCRPAPWGWSRDAKNQFLRAGLPVSLLPTDPHLDQLRLLSHRRTSIKILNLLRQPHLAAIETTNPGQVTAFETLYPGSYIKSPWSGSGKGVIPAASLHPAALYNQAKGIIHRQGSVMIEHGLDRILDFAALFQATPTKVRHQGWSIFLTQPRGMYQGNILAPQSQILDRITSTCPGHNLPALIQSLETILTHILTPYYQGWLGIDMMIYRQPDNRPAIHPCIEINLRTTMGIAAMLIQQRLNLTAPHLLAWEHHTHQGMPILPTIDKFTLTLTPVEQF